MKNRFVLLTAVFVVSIFILAWIYPQIFISQNRPLLSNHDTAIPLENTFDLVSSFYFGKLQLYDAFDGFNIAYSHLTSGVYTVVNILVAVGYLVLSPLSSFDAKFFHDFYTVAYAALTTLIRILGGYLLLTRFVSSRLAIALALIIYNLFCTSQFFYNGMHTNNLYSYLPMVLYYGLRLFDYRRLIDLAVFILSMSLAVANAPLFALGYFYVPLHFFLLAGIVTMLFLPKTKKLPTASIWKVVAVLALAVIIMAPSIAMYPLLKKDFFIASSGLGETAGRLNQALSVSDYFNFKGRSYANPLELPQMLFTYTQASWGWSWMFLGWGVVVLSILGVLSCTNPWGWAVLAALLGIILVNVPAGSPFPFNIGHWIYVLTNPFHFLSRSFHMSALLAPFVLLPFIGLGIEALMRHLRGGQKISSKVLSIAALTCLVLVLAAQSQMSIDDRRYLYGGACLWGGILVAVKYLNGLKRTAVVIILAVLLLGADLLALKHYTTHLPGDPLLIKPTRYERLMVQERLILDYQNPKVYPWRTFLYPSNEQASIYLYSHQGRYGNYYRFNPLLERYSRPCDLYQPRAYVLKDLPGNGKAINDIYQQRVTQGVRGSLDLQEKRWALDIHKYRRIHRGDWDEYHLVLPKTAPPWLATSVFTQDASLIRLRVGEGIYLTPAQGALTAVGMFDVQNIRKGYVAIAWPSTEELPSLELIAAWPKAIRTIDKFTPDEMVFRLDLEEEGPWMIHLPFDDKWQAYIDGHRVTIHRWADFFMAVDVPQGQHELKLLYWPQTPLRGLILLMITASVLAAGYLLWPRRLSA